MNKEKYLKALEKRIDFLDDETKAQVIFEISNDLDNENNIRDLSTVVREIEEKYSKKKKNKKIIKKSDNKLVNFYYHMRNNDFKSNAIIIRDIIILILLASLLKIPFLAVETISFEYLNQIVSIKILNASYYIIEGIYAICAILYFVDRFKKRFKKEME